VQPQPKADVRANSALAENLASATPKKQ